jgi:hypothetical protein
MVEDAWLETAHDRALFIDGAVTITNVVYGFHLVMWFTAFTFRMWHNLRPGGATGGK